MSDPGSAVFTADSIGVSFRGRPVLKSATAWARAGSITALLGRNGCGKTTLVRAALGLGRRDFGVVRFADRAWERPRLPVLARHGLFFLPDRGLLSWRRTVAWHLRAVSGFVGRTTDLDDAAELGVEELLERRTRTLSGGERRRAEVSIALMRRPTCLIADEPLSEVGPRDRGLVAAGLRRLADRGCAILVTGQEVDDLLKLSDLVVWMVGGTTHWIGSSGEAMAHPEFRLQYLGDAESILDAGKDRR